MGLPIFHDPARRFFTGFPVVVFDGTNADALVSAMGFKEGDGIVVMAKDEWLVMRASQLDQIAREPAEEI